MKRVKRFVVYQTSKVAAIIIFLITLVFVVPFAIVGSIFGSMFGGNDFFPGFPIAGIFLVVLLPVFYAVFGFISTAISCAVYNLIAKWTGGIELEFEEVIENKE